MTNRIKRFLIAGLSAALVNLFFMVLFVEAFGFTTYILKNLANILSIEISILYHFTVSRFWTWHDAPRRKGKNLLGQFISFHVVNITGMIIRITTFAILDKLGMYYILNVTVGICLAAAVSFILYDRIVFKRDIH